jgi:hypothetical protein
MSSSRSKTCSRPCGASAFLQERNRVSTVTDEEAGLSYLRTSETFIVDLLTLKQVNNKSRRRE